MGKSEKTSLSRLFFRYVTRLHFPAGISLSDISFLSILSCALREEKTRAGVERAVPCRLL